MTKTKNWFKWSLMGGLLAAATAASAGLVTISPSTGSYNVGGTIVFRVSDSDPAGMCSGDFCLGDFRVSFDPTTLEFLPFELYGSSVEQLLGSDWSVVGGPAFSADIGSYVDVSVLLLDGTPASGPEDLFSLRFKLLGDSFPLASVSPEITGGAVPEPTSYALVMLAFAAMGGVARRKGRRSA